MEKREMTLACGRPGMLVFLLMVFAMVFAGFCNAARAGVTATITQGYPQATPDTVAEGDESVLAYDVTIAGLNPHESVSSQVKSQVYVFEAGDQLTNVNDQHFITTVEAGPASASTFTITVDGSSIYDGPHTVSFVKGDITLADGTVVYVTPGDPAPTDTFTVTTRVVTVSGQPFCVIPANANEQWDSDVTSTYRASANFSLAVFSYYHWSSSANINLESAQTLLDSVNCDGVTSTGPGKVTCKVYSFYSDQPYTGDAQVTVANQFKWKWNTTTQEVINTGISGGENISLAPGASTGSSVTTTYSVTAKAALSASFNEASIAAQSLDLSLGFTYTGSSTQTDAYKNGGTSAVGVCIGQELTATGGTVVISTPPNGPGSPQTVYKYALDGNGLSVVTASLLNGGVNGFTPYTDKKVADVYDVSQN